MIPFSVSIGHLFVSNLADFGNVEVEPWHFRTLTNLKTLKLRGHTITEENLRELTHLTALTNLSLDRCKRIVSLEPLKSLTTLRTLRLPSYTIFPFFPQTSCDWISDFYAKKSIQPSLPFTHISFPVRFDRSRFLDLCTFIVFYSIFTTGYFHCCKYFLGSGSL